jgi:predicted transcriptional regulator
MTDKELVQDLLQRMPDDTSLQDIAYELEFIAAVQQGVAELDNRQWVSAEEIERDLIAWLTESNSHPLSDRT